MTLRTAGHRRDRIQSGGAIVGVHKIHERRRAQLRLRKPQDAPRRGIDADEIAVERGHAEEIGRQREKTIELVGRPLALLRTAPTCVPTVVIMASRSGVGLEDVAVEELHHADHGGTLQHRHAERCVQADLPRHWRARKIRIARDVGNPRRLRGTPTRDRAGRLPGANVELPAGCGKLVEGKRRRLPHADATGGRCGRGRLPTTRRIASRAPRTPP